jgi:hypothetical protein
VRAVFDPIKALDDHVAVINLAGDCRTITWVEAVDDQLTTAR